MMSSIFDDGEVGAVVVVVVIRALYFVDEARCGTLSQRKMLQ